jgi:transposase
VLSMYRWQQVKILKAKGVGIKKIARLLKISKNTVRKYLRNPNPPQFKAREYVKELDNYQQEITEMLVKKYIGTRIHEELIKQGYQGSLSSVHRYLRGIKEEERAQLATTRVETPPGRQMQYDWKEWKLPVGGQLIKIYLHEVVLAYSRKKYYSFSLTITAQDVIRANAEAIHFFGLSGARISH